MKVTDEQVERVIQVWRESGLPLKDAARSMIESLGGVWLSEVVARDIERVMRKQGFGMTADMVADQLTPETPEPTGKWAVVRDARGADPAETDSGYIIPKHTPAASGGETKADGDQSERVEFCRNCAKCGMEVWGLRPGGICFKCHDDTPAAEPDRVTLPDPTPPIVWSFADEEPWRPEHITFNGAKYILAQPPEAPDEAYERGEDSGSCGECGVWTDARTWGACPECFAKADPAETDAPTDWLSYINEKAEAEAKRGRDEALAVVVKALRERREDFGRSSTRLDAFDLTALAEAIEREAGRPSDVTDGRTDDLTSSRLGGDGHE